MSHFELASGDLLPGLEVPTGSLSTCLIAFEMHNFMRREMVAMFYASTLRERGIAPDSTWGRPVLGRLDVNRASDLLTFQGGDTPHLGCHQ